MLDDILFYGDPHGEYETLFGAIRERTPEAIILLGDFDAEEPLERLLAPAIEAVGRDRIWWIPGNHDSDRPERYLSVFESGLADRNLHGRVVDIAGVRIAGLGGVFRGQVWYPRDPDTEPRFRSRADYLASIARSHHWRGGLPLKHRTTIFPEDIESLAGQSCDILVTHEGPSTAEYGFEAIERLAGAMGARAVVHGHLHVDYTIEASNGVVCVGCGEHQPKWGGELGVGLGVRIESSAPAGLAMR